MTRSSSRASGVPCGSLPARDGRHAHSGRRVIVVSSILAAGLLALLAAAAAAGGGPRADLGPRAASAGLDAATLAPRGTEIPYETSPYWLSASSPYSTGAALADLDRDGWLDLVVADGNDIAPGHVGVYYNDGGALPTVPDWQSADIDYHGHLSVGDVSGDGWPDVAVSVYLGPDGFGDPGRVKLYLNDGAGTLGTSPAWTSADEFYSFRCALGDVDLDGDLDLAAACGESYDGIPQANRIYRNNAGTLETSPFWLSAEIDSSYDASWCDVDRDGDLDLAFCNSGGPNRVYYNNGGTLSTTAGWSSTDASLDANTLAWGDVSGDGWPELAVADNNQLGGSGKFKLYLNNGAGMLATTPAWSSAESGYGSSVAFSDVDDDGDLDLASGQWWGAVRIHRNDGGTLTPSAVWTSTTGSVVERIAFGDVDRDETVSLAETFEGTAGRTLYVLTRRPLEAVTAVEVGGTPLAVGDYCFDKENGWVSLAEDPAGASVTVRHAYSYDQEMAVSNWDPGDGNFLFRNTGASLQGVMILAGPGPGADNPPEVRGFSPADTGTPLLDFLAYSVNKFGVNVAAGEVDGAAGREILTGPGPGAVFGPQVRTFDRTGTPVAGGSFLAYGTNRFGVLVSTGNLDGAGQEEYVTGPGPGAVFGPHVRAFRLVAGAVQPVPGVSFFAYGTHKWGVNVACGNLDGDGSDEIVTGAGPGEVFGPHVRGWNVDGGTASPLPGVSFLAYGTPRWGVNVACGDLDGDGYAEIVTGAGPGRVFGPHVRGWNVDGGTAAPMPGINFFAFSTSQFGVEVGCGDLDGDGMAEILTAPGPGPTFGAQVRGWNYDGVALTPIAGIDFLAFPPADVRQGANVAVLEE